MSSSSHRPRKTVALVFALEVNAKELRERSSYNSCSTLHIRCKTNATTALQFSASCYSRFADLNWSGLTHLTAYVLSSIVSNMITAIVNIIARK